MKLRHHTCLFFYHLRCLVIFSSFTKRSWESFDWHFRPFLTLFNHFLLFLLHLLMRFRRFGTFIAILSSIEKVPLLIWNHLYFRRGIWFLRFANLSNLNIIRLMRIKFRLIYLTIFFRNFIIFIRKL